MASLALLLSLALAPFQDGEYEILIRSALRKGEAKEWKAAEEEATKAIQLNPARTEAYKIRSRVRSTLGEKRKAIEDLDEAIRRDPRDAGAHWGRALLHIDLSEYQEAHDDLTQAMKLGDVTAVVLQHRGGVRRKLGDLKGAEQDCSQAIALDPKHAESWYTRSLARFDRGNFAGAMADCTETIRLDPRHWKAFVGRGNLRQKREEYDLAIKDYTEAIRIEPTDPMAWTNRGNAYLRLKNPDQAEKDYSEALRCDPKYGGAHNGRGILKYERKDLDGALRDFTEAIRFEPGSDLVWWNRGRVRRDLGDHKRAVEDFTQSLKIQPKASVYDDRSHVLALLLDHAAAIADLDRAIELEGPIAWRLSARAWSRMSVEQFDGAASDLKEALRLAPRDCDVHVSLACLAHLQGRLQEARKLLEAAVELDPVSGRAWNYLALLLFGLQDWKPALGAYREALELSPQWLDILNVRIWLVRVRTGDKDAATRELRDHFKIGKNSESWEGRVAAFLLGELSEEDLGKAAESGKEDAVPVQRVAAPFFAGVKRLLDGDEAGARERFLKCVEARRFMQFESMSARDELRILDGKKK